MLDFSDLFSEDRAKTSKVSGKWFEVRLTPDLVAGELINIGVAFVQNRTGKFSFRLLESAAPFDCLYGKQAREQFEFLLKITRLCLQDGSDRSHISPHITFGKPRHAQGESASAIIDSLFSSVVTLGRNKAEPKEKNGFQSLTTEDVQNIVFEAMRDIDKLAANQMINMGTFPLTVETDDGPHQMFFPLRNEARFGSVVSAWYRQQTTAESNIKSTLLDLGVATKSFPQNMGGLFILRADHSTLPNEADQLEIDKVVSMTEWRAKKLGITLQSDYDPARLAQTILEWGWKKQRHA